MSIHELARELGAHYHADYGDYDSRGYCPSPDHGDRTEMCPEEMRLIEEWETRLRVAVNEEKIALLNQIAGQE